MVEPEVPAQVLEQQRQHIERDIRVIDRAIGEWAILHRGHYPSSLELLVVRDDDGATSLVDRALPVDPWGRAYLYDPPAALPRIFTLGRDGRPGGTGADTDVDSWEVRGLYQVWARSEIATIEAALHEWFLANGGRYPATLDKLIVADGNGEAGLDAATLRDPWGRCYLYDPPGKGEPRLHVYTYGRDGSPGGTGQDADLHNWSAEAPR